MQVIIVKPVRKHKVNDVVNVPDGFAVNFLIPRGYALLATKRNKAKLAQKVVLAANQAKETYNHSVVVKKALSKTALTFSLRTKGKMVFGAVSNKMVLKALEAKNVRVPKFALPHVNIRTLGTTKITVKLPGQVKAEVTVVVKAK